MAYGAADSDNSRPEFVQALSRSHGADHARAMNNLLQYAPSPGDDRVMQVYAKSDVRNRT